jgi:hypothetical protein
MYSIGRESGGPDASLRRIVELISNSQVLTPRDNRVHRHPIWKRGLSLTQEGKEELR